MSSRQGAEAAGLGWLATLGGAGILLAFGFGIGLVAGSALEEPDLVAKHLAGEATELPLPEAAAKAPSDAGAKPPSAAAASPPRAAEPGAPAQLPAEAPSGEAPSDFDTGDGGEAPAPGPEAVGTPKPPPRAEPAPPPKPRPAPAPSAPTVASRPPTPGPSGFAVQVGAFGDRAAADALVASLRQERLRAYVAEGGAGESARFRVRVGPFGTRQQASDEAARLQKRRRLPTWVIAEGGP